MRTLLVLLGVIWISPAFGQKKPPCPLPVVLEVVTYRLDNYQVRMVRVRHVSKSVNGKCVDDLEVTQRVFGRRPNSGVPNQIQKQTQ